MLRAPAALARPQRAAGAGVPLLTDIAHTLSYTHPSLVPVTYPFASHHTSPWNPSILTWEFNTPPPTPG